MNLMGVEVNLVWFILIFFTIYMVIFSFLINVLEPFTPKIICDAFGYGKTTNANLSKFVRMIQVPKSYFKHFYIFAVLLMGFLFILCIRILIFEENLPTWMKDFFKWFCHPDLKTSTTPEGILIVMLLFNVQCWRRLYECLYINIDTGSKMNILHYIVGFAHYFCAAIGYLSESPGFAPYPDSYDNLLQWLHIEPSLIKIRWYQICAVILFFVAWRKQFESHKIFAELKTKTAHNHSIPHGGWFQYVSCPHYFAEILIYLSLAIILGTNHQTGWLVFVWVLTNQIIAGLMSHWWYQKTFPNYPTRRKAVIPYVL